MLSVVCVELNWIIHEKGENIYEYENCRGIIEYCFIWNLSNDMCDGCENWNKDV